MVALRSRVRCANLIPNYRMLSYAEYHDLMIYYIISCCTKASSFFTKIPNMEMMRYGDPLTTHVDLLSPLLDYGLPVKSAPSFLHSKHSTNKGKKPFKINEASVRKPLSSQHLLNSLLMANPIDHDAAAGDPFTNITTRGHEAERTADDASDCDSYDDAIEKYKEQGRTGTARLQEMASWAGQPAIKGSSESMRLALLTFSIIGLQ